MIQTIHTLFRHLPARHLQPEAELARAQVELTRHVGPIARILVKRAAPGCADVAQLWHPLSENVDGPARATFLAKL